MYTILKNTVQFLFFKGVCGSCLFIIYLSVFTVALILMLFFLLKIIDLSGCVYLN